MSTGATTPLLGSLVDDAAIFPPGNTPLPDAVAAHVRHRDAWYAPVVGPFLVSDVRLGELTRVLESYADAAPLPCVVVVTGGAGSLDPVLQRAGGHPRLELRGVEIGLRDEDDLARNARRVMTVLGSSLPEDVAVSVELPRPAGGSAWAAAADVVAEYGHRLKFRTGGDTATAHPDPVELAVAITAAIDREVAFKCTAGLHHAVRTTAPGTGFEEHGFLNVLLAARAVLDGAGEDDVVRVLAERDASSIAAACADMPDDVAARVRRWFVSFGSCSVDEPVTDLVELGLLTRDVAAAPQATR